MAYPIERPHIAWPIRRGPDGKLVCVEQDTAAHVETCENMIVRCPAGFRTDRPEFGWRFPTFRQAPLNPAELETALRRWEPRSQATATELADTALAAVRHFEVEINVEEGSSG